MFWIWIGNALDISLIEMFICISNKDSVYKDLCEKGSLYISGCVVYVLKNIILNNESWVESWWKLLFCVKQWKGEILVYLQLIMLQKKCCSVINKVKFCCF